MSAPKKSLFNRPAWAAKDGPGKKEPSVFGRHQVYGEVLELEKKEQAKREARTKERVEKERLRQEKAGDALENEQPQKKRRRISEEQAGEEDRSDSDSIKSSKHTPDVKISEKPRVTRSTPNKDKEFGHGLDGSPSKTKAAGLLKPNTTVIQLDDEDSDGEGSKTLSPAADISKKPPKKTKTQLLDDPDSDESEDDEYMRSLKRKAREKSRLQQLNPEQLRSAAAASPASDARSPSTEQVKPGPTPSSVLTSNHDIDPFEELQTAPETDPEIGILIKSAIPNSKALIVNRRASQPLQHVRDFWCARQNFEPAFSARVFFTWRGNKLFNSSTMRTVLRQLKKERGFDPDGLEDPSQGKITLEAMTEEIYQERLRAKELQLAVEANAGNQDEEEEYHEPEPPKKDGVVIKLTCQGLEEMPLRVRPHTSIAKIMGAFQTKRGVATDKKCWLIFDGDRLEPERSVEEVGFEEGDEVEVHPR